MIQKSRALLLQITATLWQQGNIVIMAPCSFTSVAQENVWHWPCMLYVLYFNAIWSITVREKKKKEVEFPVCHSCALSMLRLYCTLRACSLFKSSNEERVLVHKWLPTSPRWTACNQLTINTPFHSVRRECALPYFVLGGRARTQH